MTNDNFQRWRPNCLLHPQWGLSWRSEESSNHLFLHSSLGSSLWDRLFRLTGIVGWLQLLTPKCFWSISAALELIRKRKFYDLVLFSPSFGSFGRSKMWGSLRISLMRLILFEIECVCLPFRHRFPLPSRGFHYFLFLGIGEQFVISS